MSFSLITLQQALQAAHIDGWLMYDMRGSNTVARSILPLGQYTRRCVYWVPAKGDAHFCIHAADNCDKTPLDGIKEVYTTWVEFLSIILSWIAPSSTIIMEYWPTPNLPSQSLIDSAMKDWLVQHHVQIQNSWPFIGEYVSAFSEDQKMLHTKAASIIERGFVYTHALIQKSSSQHPVTEFYIQKALIQFLEEEGASFDHPPIVAFGRNTSVIHHQPNNTPLQPETLILIDCWCKDKAFHAPYADFTQMVYFGTQPSQEIISAYDIVWKAQESALHYITSTLEQKIPLTGADIDTCCRTYIANHGVESYFKHRTGHNIFTKVHGPGVNLDNFETYDTRSLPQNTCYSIEPGLYFDTFGIRLECNVIINKDQISLSGRPSKQLPLIHHHQ